MTPVELVADALAALCFRAHVVSGDTSTAGALAVCAVIVRDRVRTAATEQNCPLECVVNRWLAAITGLENPHLDPALPLVLMAGDRVIVRGPRVNGTRPTELVMLPTVVREAVKLIGARQVDGLVSEVA